jgi:formylglycine-generating enzyme required for sulfatase activity
MTQQTVQQALQVNPGSSVWLDDFYIKKYPVTNAQWREFVEVHGGLFLPQHWGDARQYFPSEEASLPVVGISYDHICRYLAWRGTRLPTAWEWERGARGTDGRLFPWGNEFEPSFCNVLDSNTGRLLPVDHFDRHYASPTGVRDMVGNAAEWVERRVFTQATHGHAFAQPFRGGSFLDPCLYALTFRDSAEAGVLFGAGEDDRVVGDTALRWLGFRDVIDLDPEPKAAQELLQVPETVLGIHGQQRKVPSFRMARYPVSNMEYYEFIQATGHPQPADWENDRRFAESLPFPAAKRHLPVVHVGYRDALAFCLWKSRQTGELVRLPTADEWQAAVDGGEGRRYPWGNDFDPQKCNSLTSGWGQRVPVFALRDGRSLQGIFHLVGNIREWVAPTELRGGSWRVDCQRLIEARVRETVRPRDWSRFRANDLGFRYVVQLTGA